MYSDVCVEQQSILIKQKEHALHSCTDTGNKE